jgi:hypothetical protein
MTEYNGQHRSFGWPLLRRPTMWITIAWCISMALLGVSVAVMVNAPTSKWDRAVAIGACGRFPVLRQGDGSIWLRVNGLRAYRVEGDWWKNCR